jgi:hypothetical protein
VVTAVLDRLAGTVDAAGIDLQVSANEVKVTFPLNSFVQGHGQTGLQTVSLVLESDKVVLNAAKTKASLKRKLGKLVFTIGVDRKK